MLYDNMGKPRQRVLLPATEGGGGGWPITFSRTRPNNSFIQGSGWDRIYLTHKIESVN